VTLVVGSGEAVQPDGHPSKEPSGPIAPPPPGRRRRLPTHGWTRSEQVVRTPPWLLDSVALTWGPIGLDVAASDDNAVCLCYFTEAGDGLSLPWLVGKDCIVWCNPPYNNIGAWIAHAAEQREETESVLLVLASVGSNWWSAHVHGKAEVIFLRPRITFVGETNPFPRDLALVHFGPSVSPAYYTTKLVPGRAQMIPRDTVASDAHPAPRR
jgi:phage N-6-adenine-methyltransferase